MRRGGPVVDMTKDYRSPSGVCVYRRRVRPATWREREQALFDTKVHDHPVWEDESWWTGRSKKLIDHYAHESPDDPSMIEFTASEAHGETARYTPMKPGKYLKKFFGDVLSDKKIAFYAEWFATGSKPPIDYEGTFGLATTGSEICDVYAADIPSCMEGEDSVRVYAAGDLAIAYWRDPDGDYSARALCWPERRIYGRIYPEPRDENAGAALRQAMQRKGWKDENVSDDGFNGARIQKIETAAGWVMPFIDRNYGVNCGGEFWVMSSYPDYSCDNTDGYLRDSRARCSCCSSLVHEDEIASVATSYCSRNAWATGDRPYCDHCVREYTFLCNHTLERFAYDFVEAVCVDGEIWAEPVAQRQVTLGNLFWDDVREIYTRDEPRSDPSDYTLGATIPAVSCPYTLPLPLGS